MRKLILIFALFISISLNRMSCEKISAESYDRYPILANVGNIRFPRLFLNGVRVTIYNATRAQCDETPGILADGTKINFAKIPFYRYCAISRNLHSRWGGPFDFGDTIILRAVGKHSGPWIIKDIMGPRFTNSVDLLVPTGTDLILHKDAKIYTYRELEE